MGKGNAVSKQNDINREFRMNEKQEKINELRRQVLFVPFFFFVFFLFFFLFLFHCLATAKTGDFGKKNKIKDEMQCKKFMKGEHSPPRFCFRVVFCCCFFFFFLKSRHSQETILRSYIFFFFFFPDQKTLVSKGYITPNQNKVVVVCSK